MDRGKLRLRPWQVQPYREGNRDGSAAAGRHAPQTSIGEVHERAVVTSPADAERRDLLVSVLSNAPERVSVAERVGGTLGDGLREAAQRGYEGLVLKRRGSAYSSGRAAE